MVSQTPRESLLSLGRQEMDRFINGQRLMADVQRFLEIYARGQNKAVQARLDLSIDRLINRFSGELHVSAHHRQELKQVGESFYQLGKIAAPFYVGFADWLDRRVGGRGTMIFHGRDSLGFMAAYTRRYPVRKTVYSRGNRTATDLFYEGQKRVSKEELLGVRQQIAEFYLKNGLLGCPLNFVDFGFAGSLARLECLLVASLGRPLGQISINLGVYFDNNRTSLVDKLKRNLPFDTLGWKTIDQQLLRQTAGYVNDFVGRGKEVPGFDDVGTHHQANQAFWDWLQGLGSYILERRMDAFSSCSDRFPGDKTLVSLESSWQIVARYGFMQGLAGSDMGSMRCSESLVLETLARLYAVFSSYHRFVDLILATDSNVAPNPRIEETRDAINTTLRSLSSRQTF